MSILAESMILINDWRENMKTINDKYYVRKSNLVWNLIDDEMVIIDLDNGFVHLLN